MSNNDGAAMAQCIAVGEELSRAMVEVAHLRAENERLREALREIAKTDIQTWAKAALDKGDWAIVERIAEVDQQGIACRALAGVEARTALGEKE